MPVFFSYLDRVVDIQQDYIFPRAGYKTVHPADYSHRTSDTRSTRVREAEQALALLSSSQGSSTNVFFFL